MTPFLSLLLAGPPLRAEPPPMELVATATAVDGAIYFRPGELLVGYPELPGRPALRPVEEEPATLPSDLSRYEELARLCDPPPAREQRVLAVGDLGGDGQVERVTVQRSSALAPLRLLVQRGAATVGWAELPMPAEACAGLVAETRPGGPPELLVVWTSRGPEGRTVGVSVYRLASPPSSAEGASSPGAGASSEGVSSPEASSPGG